MLPLQASTSLVRRFARPVVIKALVARCGASRSVSHNVRAIHRLSSSAAALRRDEAATDGPMDLSKLFDQVDGDKDGAIDKHEFLMALQLVKYEDFMKTQADAKENLERLAKKMATVEKLEQHLAELEETYQVKQEAYNNIGLKTAAEIDALFADSKLKKDNIKSSIGELKSLIYEARAIFNTTAKQQ